MILSGYQTGDEIERGDNSVLYTAVSQTRKTDEAVIRFRWVDHGPERETILAAIKRQEFATMAGVPSLAPILAYGQTPAGVYYVTKRFTRSLDALVESKIAVRPPGLAHLTRSILAGLQALHSRREGAHGNLKLTNILLLGTGRLRDCSVAMTDLAPTKNVPYAADIYALGLIVLQLVRRRHIPAPDWPVPRSEEWDAFDGEGEPWRAFCSFLLDPARAKDPDPVAAAQQELRSLRSKSALGSFGMAALWITVTAAVFGGGAYAARNWWNRPTVRTEQTQAEAADFRWIGRFARELSASPQRVFTDEYATARLAAPVRGLRLSDADAGTLANGGSVLAFASVFRELNAAFAAWPARTAVTQAYDLFTQLRWNIPAAAISRLRGDTFSEDLPVGDQIDLIGRTAKLLPEIQTRWSGIQAVLDRLEKTGDPVLSKVRPYATVAAGEVPGIDALPAGLSRVLNRLTEDERLWTGADKARLARDGKFTRPVDRVDAAILSQWEADARQSQSAPQPGAKP